MACGYHPGSYVMICPPSCPQPGLTSLCSSHRKRRWNCCLAMQPKAAGCARKYHMPPNQDSTYEEVLRKIQIRDQEMVEKLNKDVEEMRQQDYQHKVAQVKQTEVQEIEETYEKQREVVARYKNIKFV